MDPTKVDDKVCWYIIHTSASSELSVRDNILKMVENNGLQDQIFDVKVLEEEEEIGRAHV